VISLEEIAHEIAQIEIGRRLRRAHPCMQLAEEGEWLLLGRLRLVVSLLVYSASHAH